MQLAPRRSSAQADGLPLMLVAVNLLLLSFFVLLNALASAPTSKAERHANDVLARVREGYDDAPKKPSASGGLPQEAVRLWAAQVSQQVQGVLVNRLQIPAEIQPQAADRVVVRIPLQALFAGERLANPELVRALQLALRQATVRWELRGPAAQHVKQAAHLGALVGSVRFSAGKEAEVRLVVMPKIGTPPTAAAGVERMVAPVGASVRGEATP